MNKNNSAVKDQEGKPDEEMPELSEKDFAGAKSNRFARRMFSLDEDVSAYFKTSEAVNEALRLVIRLTQTVSHQ